MSSIDRRKKHRQQISQLARSLAGNTERLRVRKRTISNLFRYEGRQKRSGREVDLRPFDQILYLNTKEQTLEVQGLATFAAIVNYVLPRGFTPVITPELKHITIGGATVGIGIETNSFRDGFVHDSLLEADVLLPNGSVVTCSPDNEYADLFYGLPNSYGTLGYILRAKIKLHKAQAYVHLHTERFYTTSDLLQSMKRASEDTTVDYIESLLYGKDELYLTIGKQTSTSDKLTSIYGSTVFYRAISQPGDLTLTMRDYLFRYDPEWFWALPHTPAYALYRKLAPTMLRNSGFYSRFSRLQTTAATKLPGIRADDGTLEQLIQDWEVPWRYGRRLLDFALSHLDLDGKPLMTAPLKTKAKATNYPIKNSLYLNLGSYNFVRKQPGQEPYDNTKVMDEFCFAHSGIKMLYSTTFLDETAFNRIYNGTAYMALKAKYDSRNLLPTLYDKAVKGS